MIHTSSRLEQPGSGPQVLLFGPLELSFDSAAFAQIRETVVRHEDHYWILDIITELPHCWETVANDLPDLQAGPGLKYLIDLKHAFLTEQPLEAAFPLPNSALIPLVIISHLTQYAALLKHGVELDEGVDLFAMSKHDRETLGFCTGLLSAFAVSSTKNRKDFCKFGAAAVRLGMLIGMVVDARDANSELGKSRALSTAWGSIDSKQKLLDILKRFSGVRKPFGILASASHLSNLSILARNSIDLIF